MTLPSSIRERLHQHIQILEQIYAHDPLRHTAPQIRIMFFGVYRRGHYPNLWYMQKLWDYKESIKIAVEVFLEQRRYGSYDPRSHRKWVRLRLQWLWQEASGEPTSGEEARRQATISFWQRVFIRFDRGYDKNGYATSPHEELQYHYWDTRKQFGLIIRFAQDYSKSWYSFSTRSVWQKFIVRMKNAASLADFVHISFALRDSFLLDISRSQLTRNFPLFSTRSPPNVSLAIWRI